LGLLVLTSCHSFDLFVVLQPLRLSEFSISSLRQSQRCRHFVAYPFFLMAEEIKGLVRDSEKSVVESPGSHEGSSVSCKSQNERSSLGRDSSHAPPDGVGDEIFTSN
jgi:hypothetical protein